MTVRAHPCLPTTVVFAAQMCLPYSLSCAILRGNKATPCGATNTGSGSSHQTKGTRPMVDNLSYHTLFSVDNSTELQRVVRMAKSWCADLSRILYASPGDLLLLQRLYDVSKQYVNVLMVDETEALQLAADAASDEIVRRDKLTGGKFLPIKSGYVYLMRSLLDDYKIGCSARPQNRILTLGITLPYPVEILYLIFTPDMYRTEQELQDRFRDKCIAGEWYKLNEADVADFARMAA